MEGTHTEFYQQSYSILFFSAKNTLVHSSPLINHFLEGISLQASVRWNIPFRSNPYKCLTKVWVSDILMKGKELKQTTEIVMSDAISANID